MGIREKLKSMANGMMKSDAVPAEKEKSNTEHWTDHNVALHQSFQTKEQSLEYIRWRNSIYLHYDELMPCRGFDRQVILDYGCGPGHDTVGFVEYSKPAKVYAVDISSTAIQESKARLKLHSSDPALVEFIQITDGSAKLPLPDDSIDYIHSSGVLHHTPNESEILADLYRVLKKGGKARIMMYNYYSIYALLHVGYSLRILKGKHKNVSFSEALRKESDENCPIARYYKKAEFISICEKVGFKCGFKGAAINVEEMKMLNHMYDALLDVRTPAEIRDFLYELKFDEYRRPVYRGDVAGIDAVYELTK